MKSLSLCLAAALGFGAIATLPAHATSTATSSLSDSIATSVGSISDSVRGISNSSSRAVGVAEGDYRVMEVAAADEAGQVRLVLAPLDPQAAQNTDAHFALLLPQKAFDASGLAPASTVQVKHRPYGLEFANGQTRQAFFLAMTEDWYRELPNHAVTL